MIDINGQTAVYGIIGKPIGHTMSTAIHNMISETMGINAVYVPFTANDDLDSVVRGLYALGVKGINVTVPFKTEVIKRLHAVDDLAGRIGAVNTLKYTEDGYYGYNTDILGLSRELEEVGISLKERDVIILGAGGAARAVAFMCAGMEPSSVTIANRTVSKAEDILRDLSGYAPELITSVISTDELRAAAGNDLIVFQCTNVGLSPRDDECVVDDRDFYSKVYAGIDLIYKPAETMFMKYVRESGGRAYNGLKMLIYQAVSAYEIWNEVTVPADLINRIERELI